MTVRPAGVDEWRLLRALRLAALADAPGAFGSTVEHEAAFSDDEWGPWLAPLQWFVADEDGQAVGLVAATMEGQAQPGRCEVLSMWVSPRARRHGAGAALVEAVGGWAHGRHGSVLTLGVAEGNDSARRFYERLGFRPTGAREALHRDPSRYIDEYSLPI